MKRISVEIVKELQELYFRGLSLREVAKKTGVHFTTVKKYLRPQEGPASEIKNIGRPNALTNRMCRLLVRWFETGLVLTSTDASRALESSYNIKVSRVTIAKILKRFGLRNYARPRKPRLSIEHKKNRAKFSRLMKNFPLTDWIMSSLQMKVCIIFTDQMM